MQEGDNITFTVPDTEASNTYNGIVSRLYDDDNWIDVKVKVKALSKNGVPYKKERTFLVKRNWVK